MPKPIVLELPPKRGNSRNSEGAFVTLKSGRILFAYTRYKADANDEGHAVIASRHSDDGGKTWSDKDRILVRQEGQLNVMSVSLLRLHDGRIAMLNLRKDWAPWVKGNKGDFNHGDSFCMPDIRFSDDECETFTKPRSIVPVNGYHVVNNDRMIQLKSGRLIVPIALHRTRWASWPMKDKPTHPFLAGAALIIFYFSDDGGNTWWESEGNFYSNFPSGAGLQEPGVIQLKDGRLWSWCRSGHSGITGKEFRQWQSFSGNEGMHWSPPEATDFISPCSPLSMKRIPSTGHLLAIWNDHSGRFKTPKAKPISWGRTPLVSAISTDEGKTWRHHKLLEKSPEHGFCYTAIHFTDDAVLLAYCSGGATTKMVLDRLRMTRVPIKMLYT